MKINSNQLDAFYHVAQTLSFTKAAEHLHVTQSALSQRISKLEDDLETTLFIRDRSSIKLTDMGFKLLRYCAQQESAESDLLSSLKSSKQGLGGLIRIGGFSSVNRSMVVPALKKIISNNEGLSIKLITREIHELDDLLKRSEADYILTDRDPVTDDIESLLLGYEHNVLVGSKKFAIANIFLDHDEADHTTHFFFKQNKLPYKPKKIRYLDDVYGLIDGVKNGYGQAVLPRHLVEDDKDLEVLFEGKSVRTPVYLHFFKQPFYRPAHSQILEALTSYFKEVL